MRVAALFIRTVEMAERPVGQLVVERCRRGTRWLSGRAQHMNRVSSSISGVAPDPVWIVPTGEHSPLRVPRSASDPVRKTPELSYPPLLSAAQSKEPRPAGRLCDGVGSAARPRAPGRAPQTLRSRSAADAPLARTPRGFALGAKLRGGPPASPSFGNATPKRMHCRRSGGTGSGGKPDKSGGIL